MRPVPAPDVSAPTGYRPALDGVRAVAVLAVIAYHFQYLWARGGFLGVDVFFVLSGYLITGLLLAEHARSGGIEFAGFWLRRARRLLPGLLLMLAVVALWVGATSSPFDLGLRRDDLMWTLFYGANWHFVAAGRDYFAQLGSASPVQHTWSLAVEEQFYVVWPLVVGAAMWLSRGRSGAVAGVCLAGIASSVAAMVWLYDPADPSRAYFGTDARLHELMVGALLAVALSRYDLGRIPGKLVRLIPAVTAAAGVVLLAAFALLPDSSSVYYHGGSVAIAVASAVLVLGLELAPRALPARLLSLGPMAWIGRLSYGLYLWHWPAILIVPSAWGPFALLPGSYGLNGERLAVTFVVAAASYYVVERPIRTGSFPLVRRSALRFATVTVAAIVLVSGLIGWQTLGAVATGRNGLADCPDWRICLRSDGGPGSLRVAVVGDSVARSLDPAFGTIAREHGWTYILEASDGCRVSHEMTIAEGVVKPLYRDCYDRVPGLLTSLVTEWKPDVIVVVDNLEGGDLVRQNRVFSAGTPEHLAIETESLAAVAGELTAGGSRLVFVELLPTMPSGCAASSHLSDPSCLIRADSDPAAEGVNTVMRRIAASTPRTAAVSLAGAVCPGGICRPVVGGVMVRYDGRHFSEPGALMIAHYLDTVLTATGEFSKP